MRPCASEWVGFSVAGPASRALLQALVVRDLSTAAFPFMSFAALEVGMVRALVGRVSFTGDLGYEIWCRADDQRALYRGAARGRRAARAEARRRPGARQPAAREGLRHLGARVPPRSTGPTRRASAASSTGGATASSGARPRWPSAAAGGGPLRLVGFAVEAADADAIGDEPIWHDGAVVGAVTSGGYGHGVGRRWRWATCRGAGGGGGGFEIEIMGERRPARRLDGPAFDPDGTRMRALTGAGRFRFRYGFAAMDGSGRL